MIQASRDAAEFRHGWFNRISAPAIPARAIRRVFKHVWLQHTHCMVSCPTPPFQLPSHCWLGSAIYVKAVIFHYRDGCLIPDLVEPRFWHPTHPSGCSTHLLLCLLLEFAVFDFGCASTNQDFHWFRPGNASPSSSSPAAPSYDLRKALEAPFLMSRCTLVPQEGVRCLLTAFAYSARCIF